jgi:hypothetical protein
VYDNSFQIYFERTKLTKITLQIKATCQTVWIGLYDSSTQHSYTGFTIINNSQIGYTSIFELIFKLENQNDYYNRISIGFASCTVYDFH